MPVFVPVHPPRNPEECPAWLHEAIKRLNRQATNSTQAVSAIVRGETPDGSGGPLVDTGKFFYKPGLSGGQTAYGGVNSSENLILGSTAASTKGKIYLTPALTTAYDEANDFLGVGTGSPSARLQANNATSGTGNVIGATGTPMFRGSIAGSTFFDLLPIQFDATPAYDLAVKMPVGGFQVLDATVTTGLRLVPIAGRAFVQCGKKDSLGAVSAASMTLGGLGATYGTDIAFAFASAYAEGAANTPPKWGMGVGTGSRTTSPLSFGANWRGVLNLTGVSTTEAALRLLSFNDITGAPWLEFMGATTGTSPTQAYGAKLASFDEDAGSSPSPRARLNYYSSATLAGFLSITPGAGGGNKLTLHERGSNRGIAVDGISGLWADSKSVIFLEIGQSISSFKAASITSVDDSTFDRLGIHAIAVLHTDVALGAGTAAPTGMVHLRGAAANATVLLKIERKNGQTGDLTEWLSSDGTTILAKVDKDGSATFPSVSTTNAGLSSIFAVNLSPGAYSAGGPELDDGSGFRGVFYTVPAGLTANRYWEWPDGSGQIVISLATQTLQNKTLSTACTLRSSTASSGVAFEDNTTTTKKLRMVLSGAVGNNSFTISNTAARDYLFPDVPGQVQIVGNGADGPASGAIGRVNRTAQTAAVGSTNLTNSTPAGYYIVHYTIEDTTADATAGTIQFQINYTDDVGATTQTGAALVLTATGRDRGSFEVYLASGNITYQTNLTGIIGTAQYALRVRCEFLG